MEIDTIRRPLSDSQRLRFAKEIKGRFIHPSIHPSICYSSIYPSIYSSIHSSIYILSGLKVEVTHTGPIRRKYRVCNVTRRPASAQTLVIKMGVVSFSYYTVCSVFLCSWRTEMCLIVQLYNISVKNIT